MQNRSGVDGVRVKYVDRSTIFRYVQNCKHIESNVANGNLLTNSRSSATAEIARVDGHYAVQGNSRSSTWYLSKARMRLPISELLHIIGQICAVERRYLSLTRIRSG